MSPLELTETYLGRIERLNPTINAYVTVTASGRATMPEFVGFLTYLFSDVLGHNAHLTDGVRRALGREPRDFGDFVRATAASGVWNPAVTSEVT
jgi:hypothetical protein